MNESDALEKLMPSRPQSRIWRPRMMLPRLFAVPVEWMNTPSRFAPANPVIRQSTT